MNNEGNNLRVNNDLPPMGTMVDNNSDNKLNLPPISSFTNFGDSSVSTDNNASANNTNDSIFNLMDQFDQVSTNNMNQSTNQPLSRQSINLNNVQDNLILNDISNGQPSINGNSFINQAVNNMQFQTPNLNTNEMPQTVSNNNPVQEMQSQSPLFNMESQQQPVNNMMDVQELEEKSPIFNMNGETNQAVNNMQFQTPNLNTNEMPQTVSNNNPVQEMQSQPSLINMNNNSVNSNANNQFVSDMNNIQTIATEPMDVSDTNLISSAPMINNQPQEELISKFSMDEANSNENKSSNDNAVNLNNNTIFNTLEKNTNTVEEKIDNNKKSRKNKSKRNKLLFIILLVATIVLVGIVMVICYFKFWKSDKLVCSLQDYSNERFLVEESMIMNFKGSNLVNANLKRNLVFVESYMDSKATYLEELRNQFEGLGFDVSYSENETGFEISMNFTKEELENWYGETMKNSSKDNMLKEMKNVGYTCK